MHKLLCTFSGRQGDILWSLATAHELYKSRDVQLMDFAVMPQYKNLLPLLAAQPYIENAFVFEDWIIQGSPFGDQPWLPPNVPGGYDEVRHLTYRFHPTEPLAIAIAAAQGIGLTANPFIFVPDSFVPLTNGGKELYPEDVPLVAYAFNWMAKEQKDFFINEMAARFFGRGFFGRVVWVDLTKYDWLTAAAVLKKCKMFVGCRSANYVLAHGMGKKVLVYEPALERRPPTYGYPLGTEVMPELHDLDGFERTIGEWIKCG